jgi:hypothetical protein
MRDVVQSAPVKKKLGAEDVTIKNTRDNSTIPRLKVIGGWSTMSWTALSESLELTEDIFSVILSVFLSNSEVVFEGMFSS